MNIDKEFEKHIRSTRILKSYDKKHKRLAKIDFTAGAKLMLWEVKKKFDYGSVVALEIFIDTELKKLRE